MKNVVIAEMADNDQCYNVCFKTKKRKYSEERGNFASNLKRRKYTQYKEVIHASISGSNLETIDSNSRHDSLDNRLDPLQCDVEKKQNGGSFSSSSPRFNQDTDFTRFVSSNQVDFVLSPRTWNCIEKEDYDALMYRFDGEFGVEDLTLSSQSSSSVEEYPTCSENQDSSETDALEENCHSHMNGDCGSIRVGDVGSFPWMPDKFFVALDCEMVGVGVKGSRSALARCSIVDYNGNVIYDRYIKPNEPITDYRTRWSGIRPRHMLSADPIDLALQDIHRCIQNRIVIGHAVFNDFSVIRKHPPCHMVRDTARCKLLVDMAKLEGQGNSLKKLAFSLLGKEIQSKKKGHDSVEDAITTLELYKLVRSKWEPELFQKWSKKGLNVHESLRLMEDHERNHRDEVDYLSDKYWPSDLLS